jgi:hypothetical protein
MLEVMLVLILFIASWFVYKLYVKPKNMCQHYEKILRRLGPSIYIPLRTIRSASLSEVFRKF